MLKTFGKSSFLKTVCNNCAVFSSKSQLPGLGLTNVKKKIGDDNIKITLIGQDEGISITSLAEATKISKRRDLKLVKIVDLDTKTSRPVYKLMSGKEYHIEDFKRREENREARKEPSIKGEKFLPLSANIAKHDLQTNLKKISKWLLKLYEIRIVINGDEKTSELSTAVFADIQNEISKFGEIKQKHVKKGNIKFQIVPFLKTPDKTIETSKNNVTSKSENENFPKSESISEDDSSSKFDSVVAENDPSNSDRMAGEKSQKSL